MISQNYTDTRAAQTGSATNLPTAGEVNSALEEPVGLTTFIDAEDVRGDVAVASLTTDNSRLMSSDTSADEIGKVLCRPAFMNNLTWSSTDAANSTLAFYDLPQSLPAYSAIKKCKLQYNTFMQADVVFRIEASPIQFQSGRLYIAFEPYRYERAARATPSYPQSYTALPGIVYDPAKPSPVEFRIPFSSMLAAYDLPLGQYGCGQLLVFVLSPLNSSASTSSVTLSVQSWLENVKLTVPTMSQSRNAPYGAASFKKASLEYTNGEPQIFQSNEQALANRHRFSRTADRVSSIASFLGSFPLLSAVANPVAAFAKGVSKAAAAFGFAKPSDLSAPTKIVSHNRAAWTNGDGPLPIVSLTESSDYALDQKGRYFPSPVDEMDINYVCSNMAMLNAWSWSTTDPVGKVVTVIPVHPGLCNRVSGAETLTYGVYAPTPLAYVASMFRYWGGALKFKLDAVATPFHAGRLLVVYLPDYDPTVTLTINEVGNNYSVLWDITDSSTLEFEVPYLGNTPYLNVFLDDQAYTGMTAAGTASDKTNRIRSIQNGALMIFVLNQLVAPTSTATSIPVQNWIGGGKDISFAEPVFGTYVPSANYSTRIDNTAKSYAGVALTQPSSGATPTRSGQTFQSNPAAAVLAAASSSPAAAAPTAAASNTAAAAAETPTGKSVAKAAASTAPTDITSFMTDASGSANGSFGSRSNFIPMSYLSPQDRAKMVSGEVITNLRQLTRRLAPAYSFFPHDVTTDGGWESGETAPNSNHVLIIDPDYFSTATGQGDTSIYTKNIAPVVAGKKPWLTEHVSPLAYISYLYAFARGSRRYGVSTAPSNIINATKWARFADESDPTAIDNGAGTFDFRMSTQTVELVPPLQPYFAPDWGPYAYNFENKDSTTVGINSTFGLNPVMSGNPSLQKSGEPGCGAVVSVPPSTRYPTKLVVSTSEASATEYVLNKSINAPRSRRFLEIRYKPFSNSSSGNTTTYTPKFWPFPTVIAESAGDDFSFGGLVPPPLLVRTTKSLVIPDISSGTRNAF